MNRVIRQSGVVIGVLLLIIIIAILICLILLVIVSPGKVTPIRNEKGEIIEGSIAEKTYINVNGVKIGMFIKGYRADNPVLLFIHGGPGMPEYFLNTSYPNGLEKYFTVVYYDQRGAGLSYDKDIPKETFTMDQMVEDAAAVTNYLRERFGQDKIYLLGHSWGSSIGIETVYRYPELYRAYIGMSQVGYNEKAKAQAYHYLADYYEKQQDYKMLKKINIYWDGSSWDPTGIVWDESLHKAGVGTTRDMRSTAGGIFLPVMRDHQYTVREKINIWRGRILSQKSGLHNADSKNYIETMNEFKIPIYFFSGAYDYNLSFAVSREYLERIKAPVKGFYLFENSAHSPLFEEPQKGILYMTQDVLKGKADLCKPLEKD